METDKDKQAKPKLKERLKSLKGAFADLGFLLGMYRKYALAFLIITVGFWAVWGPANSLLQVYVSRVVIGKIVAMEPYWSIVGAAAMMYGAQALLGITTNILGNVYQRPKTQQITYKVRREIYMKALATDYKYYDYPEFYNDFTWAAQNLTSTLESARSILENLVQNITQFAAMAAYIAAVGPWVFVIVTAGMLINAFLTGKYNSTWYNMYEKTVKFIRRANYVDRMFYTVEPAADLKATRLREYLFNTYDKAADEHVKLERKYAVRISAWLAGRSFVNSLTTVALIAMIVRSVTDGDVADIATYTALLAAANMLNNALSNIAYVFTDMTRTMQYTNRIRKFFDTKSSIEPSDGAGAEPDGGALSVEFRGVVFAYGEVADEVARMTELYGESKDDMWEGKVRSGKKTDAEEDKKDIIKGLDMSIAPGEKIAIVGENGAGKSTLMKLLLRLYDAKDGEIRIGGRPVCEYDARKLRDAVGIAFQTSHAYAMPMAENLKLYRDADKEKLIEILKAVGLNKLLEKESNLDAEVTREFDDDGIMLSGGEMQKFALARLLTGDFGLLILDEPTASLDPLAEYELNKLIMDRSRPETTIVIAHRLSTIRDADRIYLVDDGRVAEYGSHDELMAHGGKYAEMFTKQSENYIK